MDPELTSLIAASLTLVGGHFIMSHPLRPAMVRVLGANGFQGVYSLVSLGSIVWMYFAFTSIAASTTPFWPGFDDFSWAVGSAIALVSMVFYAGSMTPANAALATPKAEEAARAEPKGIFTVTRHPMMWGFALWAISHIIAAPTARTLVVASAVLALALIGAHFQDRKKQRLMGEAWKQWESRTSFWPRWGNLVKAGWVQWLIAVALWLGLSWLHNPIGGWDAGIWRWI